VVRLFLPVMEEYAQGGKTIIDPCAKRERSSGRPRTPSSGVGVCGHISRGVAWDVVKEGTGVHHRPETGN
jgi:hypothetical protein